MVEADFAEVEINELIAKRITVRNGGTIDFKAGSSLSVNKGTDESRIVVVDGSSTYTLTFPSKSGTITVDTDLNGYISVSALANVVTSVNNVTGTIEDKFNALMTQLEALANS